MSPATCVIRLSVIVLTFHIFMVNAGNSILSQYTFSTKATPAHCYQNVTKCYPMNMSTCLDINLHYRFTHPPINWSAIDTNDEQQVQSEFASIHSFLAEWNGLRVIPQCWKALQSVLCASFFPRCDVDEDRISLPTPEMCKLIRGPCRLIDQHFHWPPFLRCDDSALFPPKCPNDYTDFRFAIQPVAQRCPHPLVSTDDSNIWYPGIDGCALRCDRDLYYTEAQQLQISRLIAYGSFASFLLTVICCATYIINWKHSNKFPQVCVCWLNGSLSVASLGWIPQLFKGRTEVVCRTDNTTRYGESSIDSACVVSFFLIYFGTMSALFWYTIFAYSCHYSYQGTENRRQRLNEKSAMFYMISILVPFVLTIINIVVGEIDADPVYGICFVGLVNTQWRIAMVFVPFGICVFLGSYWNILSIRSLILINRSMRKQKSVAGLSERSVERKCAKTKTVIIRLTYTWLYVIIAFLGIAFISYFQIRNNEHHRQQLDSYVICNLNITNPKILPPKSAEAKALKQMELEMPYPLMRGFTNYCEMLLPRPNMLPVYWQFLLYFLASVTSASWLCTRSTLDIWRRFFRGGLFSTERNRHRTKSKQIKNGQNRITNEDYVQKNALSGTGTAAWQNNTGADQSSLGFLDRAEVGVNHHGRRSSSRRRYHDPAEMDINSVTTATSQNSWSTVWKERFQTLLNPRSMQLLNKSGIVANSARPIPGTAFQNGHKQIEPSSVSQVINFQNTEHEQSVSDSMTSHFQVDSAQHSTCTEPVGATNIDDDGSRNTRRKTKKERKARLNAMVRRRGSDTSGSVISSARLKQQQKKVATTTTTTSTSTRDLPAALQDSNLNPLAFPNPIGPFQPSPSQINPMAFRAPLAGVRPQFVTPGAFHHRPSFLIGSPTFPQPIRPRPIRPAVRNQGDSAFTFTHGMSDQAANSLVNPLEQVRRPDSCVQNFGSSKNANRSPTIQQGNFALQTLSANQSMMMNPHQNAQQFGYAPQRFPMMFPNLHPAAFGTGPNPYGTIPNAALVTPQGSYYNTAAAAAMTLMQQQQQMSYSELQALRQEREALVSLVTPMRSDSVASSVSKFFPIVLSDSEGMFSDAASMVSVSSGVRPSGGFKDIKKDFRQKAEELKDEIEDRFKQIEKKLEAQQEDTSPPKDGTETGKKVSQPPEQANCDSIFNST